MKKILILLLLAGCNSVNVKPDSLDKSQLFYADPGGYTMRYAIKQELEERGYKVIVGKARGYIQGDGGEIASSDIMGARYIVKASERSDSWLNPLCMLTFNGTEWWRFNVSISDQKTGEELLAWTGRGCARSNIRRLHRLMDELERD